MPNGIVQFFLESKGYGYIRVPDTGEEFYVRRRHLLEKITKGDEVTFEIREDKNGFYAAEVKIRNKSPKNNL